MNCWSAPRAANMSLDDIQMNSEDFLQKEQLDAGGFGMVSLCYHKRHGLVVLKTVYTGPQRTECNTSLLEEGKIMLRLNHERVVKLLGIILEDGNYSLVMEYVRKGNLMSVLKATSIPLSVKGCFILEIIEGMLYLTEQGLVHKDLKPENILVDEDFHIKIADLGVARFKSWSRLTKEESIRKMKINCSSKSNAGTLFYMAPEHLASVNTTPVEKSDVYSFGIVLWAIFANKEPYENALTDAQIYFCIMNGDRPLIEEIEESCPGEIITLMKQSWSQKPEERPTFAEINLTYKPFYQQNFEKDVEDDLRKLKEKYPEPTELIKRMQSLQVDAMAEPPSNGRMDLPGSLHSSPCPEASNTVDEGMFAACPVNEPVESCETSLEPPVTLERKLQDELNYHLHGSRMDKAEGRSVPHSAEMLEEERRRKVSHDPYAKAPAARLMQESHLRSADLYNRQWKPSPIRATPERGNNILLNPVRHYGPGPANLRASVSPEDLYGSANPFSFNKPPVPESGVDRQPNPFRPYYFGKSFSAETGEPASYNIYNSSAIQIGSHNVLTIRQKPQQICTMPENTHYNPADYQKLFENAALVSEVQLNLVRDNMGKKWKPTARQLGFSDPDLEEIDHDYERDGLKEKVYQMFQRWLMKEGSKGATVGKLARALFASQRIDLLAKIKQESEVSNK
ncbi:receptor-interacting serine/threonine-protein kinase 1 isoform X2 [Zootoca vivipara]|uniref:receptor-interacting serine/threonine-protein kinase 1 isoform X2 n=1 Tax=Zootoca vivipara TaxID=8524 RepID=UPI001591FA00|nr:receptor-interacting serine/threonine-protein kinase 1 isoform X2 [Zootoca vivipara]